jgi:small ligand-binding sensory domain FIST
LGKTTADLALVFINSAFSRHYPSILERIRRETSAKILAGCSGYGVIGAGVEVEEQPALSLLALSAAGATFEPFHFTQEMLEEANGPAYWHLETGVLPDDVNAWLLFADPFHLDCERFVNQLNEAYPEKPVVGGLASSASVERMTWLFLNDTVHEQGAVGIAVGGALTVRAVVAQGCMPIGEPWTITKAERNIIHEIGSQPAFQVLARAVESLPQTLQKRVQHNLFVGLVTNEYQEEYRCGDFLIRNLMGADPKTGAIVVGAHPRVGQTLQFQLRDADAAAEEIRLVLKKEKSEEQQQPIAGLLCCCNGRGRNLFHQPSHDAHAVAEVFGDLPLTGFFCNGEIGPVGAKNYLHGFTASLALFVPMNK